jgi:hypothetical protein
MLTRSMFFSVVAAALLLACKDKAEPDARQASQGATADAGANGDDKADPEDKAVLDRTAARAARQRAKGDQGAQAQAALATVCSSIQLDPVHAAMFSIEKASPSVSDPVNHACDVIIQAKQPITQLSLDWVYYDKDGVKLGDSTGYLKDLAAGDKQKMTFATRSADAVKIVSKPR